jgi:hypothetical protein
MATHVSMLSLLETQVGTFARLSGRFKANLHHFQQQSSTEHPDAANPTLKVNSKQPLQGRISNKIS